MQNQKLYTVPEIAQILGVNQGKVHELRTAGLLPFMKLGRYKLRAAALDRFLEEVEGKDVDSLLRQAKREGEKET